MTENSGLNNKITLTQNEKSDTDGKTFFRKKDREKKIPPRKERRADVGKIVKITAGVVLSLFILACSVLIYVLSTQNVVWHEDMDPVFYIEKEKLLCADLSRPDKIPLSVTSDSSFSGNTELDSFCLSDDKKHLIFTTDFKEIDKYYTVSYDLMYFNLEFPENGCACLAEDITSYSVNDSFDSLTYVKNENGVSCLYQSDFYGNEELVCDSFGTYQLCLSNNRLLYSDKNSDVYLKVYGERPLLLSHRAVAVYADDDFSEFILCSEEGELFRMTDDTVICENAAYESYRKGIFPEFSDAAGFYITSTESYSIADFVTDDMLSTDKRMRYTDEGYEAKLMRDAIRTSLIRADGRPVTFSLNGIFYYDGEKSYPVAENATTFSCAQALTDGEKRNDILLYTKLDNIDDLKVRMSELDEEAAYLLNMGELTKIKNSSSEIFLAVKNTYNQKLNADPYRVEGCSYDEKTEKLFLSVEKSSNTPDSGTSSLAHVYHSQLTNGTASEFILTDKNICEGRLYPLSDGRKAYLKPEAEKEGSFCLYADGVKVCEGISAYAEYNN